MPGGHGGGWNNLFIWKCSELIPVTIVLVLTVTIRVGYSNDNPTPLKKIIADTSNFTVAVLPMENMTVDPHVSHFFRQSLLHCLRGKGYTTVADSFLDEKLYRKGLSHAGQIRLLPFAELVELTSADAFLSGVVEQAAVQHAGVYNSYVYMCSLKLQDRSGKMLWSSLEKRVAKRRFAVDPINAFIDVLLTEAGADQEAAVQVLATQMLASLPLGPVKTVTSDSLLEMAEEIPVQKMN